MPVYPDGTFVKEAEWGRLINSFPATYVIHKDGSTYRAEHTMAGGTDYNDTDIATLMQTVMDTLTNGGKIFLRYPEDGQFLVTARMTPKYKHITIEGENPGQTTAVPSLELDDDVDDHMFFMDTNNAATFFSLKNLRLKGNGSNQTQGDGLHIEYTADVLIDHCYIYDFNESSINVTGSWGFQVRNSHLESSAYGFYGNRNYQWFLGPSNTFNYNTQSGLIITGSGATTRGGAQIFNNSFVENTQHGIFLYGNESAIREVNISGNYVRGNSYGGAGTYNGINVVDDGYALSHITIRGNTLNGLDVHGTPTDVTKYAIRLVGADDVVVDGNTILNHTETDKILVDATCQRVDIGLNPGFVNENSGSDSIANGTTSKVVAHGLNLTPSAEDFSIIGKENPDNDVGTIWVDTIGVANFTVNVEADPGASNWDFGWKVAKHKFP